MIVIVDWTMAVWWLIAVGITIRLAGKKRETSKFVDADNLAVDWIVSLLIIAVMGTFIWRCVSNALSGGDY